MRIRHRLAVASFGLIMAAGGGVAARAAFADSPPRQAAQSAVAQPRLPSFFATPNETSYVPIEPCRIVDTREGTGTGATPFTSEQVRTYYVGGTFGFAPQGGKSGGCGIPVGADAIAASVKAVNPSALGFVRAWANGKSEPTATALTYSTTEGSGVTVAINPSSAYALKLRNYGGTTHLTVDVTGYYIKAMSAMIQSDGGTYDGTTRVTNSGRYSTGLYWVQFDRSIRYCQAQANAYNTASYAKVDTFTEAQDTRLRVTMYNSTGAVADSWFYVTITC